MIKVVAKTFQVLEALHDVDGDGVRLSQIAVRVKMPTVTVFRILRSLAFLGYVSFDGASETYRIAQPLKDLGQSNTAVLLTRLARPSMIRLLSEFEQTVNMALFEEGRLVYRDMLEGLRSVRMQPIPGTFLSLVNSALGLSVLAFMPQDRAAALIKNLGAPKGLSAMKQRTLFSELERIRSTGYAVDDEMFEKGLRCVGAPILDKEGQPIGSISVSGSTSVLTNRLIHIIAERVTAECARISTALGYAGGLAVQDRRRTAGSNSKGPQRRRKTGQDASLPEVHQPQEKSQQIAIEKSRNRARPRLVS